MIFAELNNPQATEDALAILRDPSLFQWYIIPLLVIVLYIYFTEFGKKNWGAIAGGLCLYGIHWFVEIINALIQHIWGHALWTVPTGTSFLILVGVGIELSLMFSIAGVATTRLLPEDPKQKIMGLPAPIFAGLLNAILASVIEIFLVMTPAFVWVWPWWNALTVFVFVYIWFFLGAAYAYYWKKKTRLIVIGGIWAIDLIMLAVFIGIGWI